MYEPPIVAATAINNESAVETLLRKEIGTGSYLRFKLRLRNVNKSLPIIIRVN